MIKTISQCTYIGTDEVTTTLQKAPVNGKNLILPFTSLEQTGLRFGILEDTKIQAEPEIHMHEGDFWMCLEGEVTFTLGGKLIGQKPRIINNAPDECEQYGDAIENGETVVVKKGDTLYIPPTIPHQHACINGTARLIIVKVPSKP